MGFVGGLAAAAVGVLWIGFALSMGAPGPFAAFGVVFVLAAVAGAFYNLYNAAGRNRFSTFDVTATGEEPDPLAPAPDAPEQSAEAPSARRVPGSFCPYCGTPLQDDFDYCPNCGKDI